MKTIVALRSVLDLVLPVASSPAPYLFFDKSTPMVVLNVESTNGNEDEWSSASFFGAVYAFETPVDAPRAPLRVREEDFLCALVFVVFLLSGPS